jgi:hypothetical protein
MATVTDADRKCTEDVVAGVFEHVESDGAAQLREIDHVVSERIATHREASVREALDAQARRVFAAACPRCARGNPVAMRRWSYREIMQYLLLSAWDDGAKSGDWWTHTEPGEDPRDLSIKNKQGDSVFICLAHKFRVICDPDGRLAEAVEVSDGDRH